MSNSAASTAAVGTTERELLRETFTIPSPTAEEDGVMIPLFTLAPVEGDEALFTLLPLLTPELSLSRAIF